MLVWRGWCQFIKETFPILGTRISKTPKPKVDGDRKQTFFMWVLCITVREVTSTSNIWFLYLCILTIKLRHHLLVTTVFEGYSWAELKAVAPCFWLVTACHAPSSTNQPQLFPQLLTVHNELTLSSYLWNEGEAAQQREVKWNYLPTPLYLCLPSLRSHGLTNVIPLL